MAPIAGAVTAGDVLMSHRTLFVVLSSANEVTQSDPSSAVWGRGEEGVLGCANNTASVRAGSLEGTGQPVSAAQTATVARDLATAFARLHAEGFQELHISEELVKLSGKPHQEELSRMLEELVEHRNGIPPFTEDFDNAFLVLDHNKRHRHAGRNISGISIMCGVSGEFLALRAIGCCKEEDMFFLDVCDEHCAVLRRVFPRATVLCGDIRDERVQKQLLMRRGKYDIGFVSMLCQPASDAATVHDLKDLRLGIGVLAVMLMTAVKPNVMVVENVASFPRRCPETASEVEVCMRGQYAHVRRFTINALHCSVAQQRNRLFYVCCNGDSEAAASLFSTLDKQIKRQKRSAIGETG